MKLTKTTGQFKVEGQKRQYFPYVLETKCNKCGSAIDRDFSYDYISHPCFGEGEPVTVCCGACEHEQEVQLRADITLTLIDESGKALPESKDDKSGEAINALALQLAEVIFERDQITARRNTLVERYEHLREQMQSQLKLSSCIQEILYPLGDKEHEWTSYELGEIARLLEVGTGKCKVIPKTAQDEIDRHVEDGCPCGDFITAILDNDLKGAFQRADDHNIAYMKEIVTYMYAHTPADCQGSKQRRETWQDHGGLQGRFPAHGK